MAGDTRDRILGATVVCIGRSGFAKTSLDAVANEAHVGRATVYRYFPGGRDELLSEAIAYEIAAFFRRLAVEVDHERGLAERLEVGLPLAYRTLAEHEVFQKVYQSEPERLLPHLSMSLPLMVDALRLYVTPLLEAEDLLPGVSVSEAADFLARMILTFIRGQGIWDLQDPAQVRDLVRGQLLKGILVDPDRGVADVTYVTDARR